MTINKNERDFVLHHFTADRLNTAQALRQVKTQVRHASSSPTRSFRRRWVAVAAGLLMVLAFGTYKLLMDSGSVVLQTAAVQQAFMLPDSTLVTLAPHSRLVYTKERCRSVEMAGRIYFQVRHNEARPFDVRSTRAHVRVLGTQFEMDEHNGTVFVTQGRVRFSALQHDREGLILTRGQKAVLSAGATRPVRTNRADVNDVAWATHKFHFSNTPVEEVLRVLGAYYGKTFTASDLSKRLTGDFDARQEQQVVRIIEETLEISIR